MLPLVAVFLLGAAWEGAVRFFEIPVYMFPALSVIWSEFLTNVGLVTSHTLATLGTVLGGFALSIAISVPLAVLIASSPLMANAIYPLLVLTQSVPKVALAPILVVVLGAGEVPRLVVTFLVAFFPLVTSLATGLLTTPADLIELGRSYKATWWQPQPCSGALSDHPVLIASSPLMALPASGPVGPSWFSARVRCRDWW